jgi:hypothetical protein
VKTRPFGREANILAEKPAKCVIFKENGALFKSKMRLPAQRHLANFGCTHGLAHTALGVLALPPELDPIGAP